jgi:DNA-binding transcriptional ArsR family regulator
LFSVKFLEVKTSPLTILKALYFLIHLEAMSLDIESNSKVGESIEEAVFKTLSHQRRRDILRVIGEKREATFTEIKNAIGTEDSPSLSYHLNSLDYLIIQQKGKYRLSELGQDTYNLICKATKFEPGSLPYQGHHQRNHSVSY